jgi:hypothetical protein
MHVNLDESLQPRISRFATLETREQRSMRVWTLYGKNTKNTNKKERKPNDKTPESAGLPAWFTDLLPLKFRHAPRIWKGSLPPGSVVSMFCRSETKSPPSTLHSSEMESSRFKVRHDRRNAGAPLLTGAATVVVFEDRPFFCNEPESRLL